jgi:hypothetical protein
MLAAPAAELLQFDPIRSRFAVLRGRIVPLFAITALHCNDLSGHKSQLLACLPEAASAAEGPMYFVWRRRPRPCSFKSHLDVICTACCVPSQRNRISTTTGLLQSAISREFRESKMRHAFTIPFPLPSLRDSVVLATSTQDFRPGLSSFAPSGLHEKSGYLALCFCQQPTTKSQQPLY